MSRLIDLTHTFTPDMPVYPGDPSARLSRCADIESDGFTDHSLETGLHVGTHMDAPWHMIEGGKRIADFPPARFCGRGILVDARGAPAVDVPLLNDTIIEPGAILLVLTGWSSRFRQPDYYESYPEITVAFAREIVKRGVSLLGLDTPSPDREPYEIHKILLGRDVLIIENLSNLESLLTVPAFRIHAYPAKLDADAAPVRVVAEEIQAAAA
ncbi:MAG: cyclase family protein [Alphaproteobacteria bacterium]|nr:cyclase family protein [Alphaproteobacteria bacterium]